MQRFKIKGGNKLKGLVRITGSKNAALPIIAASILSDQKITIENVPALMDVYTMVELVKYLGAKVSFNNNVLTIHTPKIKKCKAPYDIVRKMRASYYVLGSLIGREKKAKVSLPGGCAIGPRPIDLHIKGLESLGAKIDIADGYINASTTRLTGRDINIGGPKGTSVGATINTMLAAVRAQGITKITPAACEPEVVDVADFLNTIGCDIKGQGTPTITINGQERCSGARYSIIPDRIEAGTFAVAAAITRSKITVIDCQPAHLQSVLELLAAIGVKIKVGQKRFIIDARCRLKPSHICVAPYPGFPTDMQAQFMALFATIPGTSMIKETIFENRFMQAVELMRMGAKIAIQGDTAIIEGVKKLSGAATMASDLRASASLVLAGLVAKGTTVVRRIYHLDRGYEKFENKLRSLGAQITRQNEN
ncbi:UDP-N-acetylglucosamine 1-carboxyvinyltransferase [candidate division WOR-3 bacterium RBG_13_43_14]|uniref:UDP-N-acetylglucosamine 1-carboxyvinyltransferase n=1 Tax=candidate division WOR-3 bacterium RBG_13_43_14 TaxID=1802590 RepID=A0A1F4U2P3_UNCW3|nr:MAG: UDP-N-acetylglucosamine 1-carboxyvinyltransferase [candidate division WOR-3 bacterium RBG_13_43_14]